MRLKRLAMTTLGVGTSMLAGGVWAYSGQARPSARHPAAPHVRPSAAAHRARAGDPSSGAQVLTAADAVTLHEDERFWTADALASAVPDDARRGTALTAQRHANRPPAGTRSGTFFSGIRQVGTFFFDTPQTGRTYCTGTVVHSGKGGLVLTAGHCALGIAKAKHPIFVPRYRYPRSAAGQPYGIFPVKKVFVDPRYRANTKKAVSDLDVAFVRVGANTKGAPEKVVGALAFTPVGHFKHNARVIGYPAAHNPRHKAIYCDVATSRLARYRQMKMTCGGFYGGVSGGPWIEGGKNVIGNVGGYFGGGDDDNDHWLTYAPVYGEDALALYRDADANRTPGARPAYAPPAEVARLPRASGKWADVRLIATADFSGAPGDDLLAVWPDGEVTLYEGDRAGGFGAERRLLAANAPWSKAVTVTAGSFTGGGQADLLVRWDTGELTLFPDVGALGLDGDGTQVAAPGSAWKDAVQLTAGRFTTATGPSDVVALWSDGSLTLHSGVGPGTTGRATTLQPAGAGWKSAVNIVAGRFSGAEGSDLLVRWADGRIDDYTGTGTGGLGTRHGIAAANRLWAGRWPIGAGAFTANGRADDLIVAWPDGETTMYADTPGTALGTETTLVPVT